MTPKGYVAPQEYAELSAYTLSLRDPAFIHQHVVDAYAAQTATPADKPIRLAQALVGLYLHVERTFTGRQVQRVHKLLADQRPIWPIFELPPDRGSLSVHEVVHREPGANPSEAVEAWAASAWGAFSSQRPAVQRLLAENGLEPDQSPS
jgi:hypothetical protein